MSEPKKKKLLLKKIKSNQQNPRTISESRLKKLINSLLVFPKMLSLRPIVTDSDMQVLGGNMRLLALNRIAEKTEDEVVEQLNKQPEFIEMGESEKAEVIDFWTTFLNKPQAEVVCADDLSESERQQFIIKDNVSFGDWDYDELENWDNAKLEGWGVDLLMPDFGNDTGGGNLPPELQGQDLLPDDLEKLQGDDRTAMQRVILCYKEDEVQALADLLGITTDDLQKKVVYRMSELGK